MDIGSFATRVAEATEAREQHEDLDGYETFEDNAQGGEPYEEDGGDGYGYESYATRRRTTSAPRSSSGTAVKKGMDKKTKGFVILGGLVAVGMVLGAIGLYVYAKVRSKKR